MGDNVVINKPRCLTITSGERGFFDEPYSLCNNKHYNFICQTIIPYEITDQNINNTFSEEPCNTTFIFILVACILFLLLLIIGLSAYVCKVRRHLRNSVVAIENKEKSISRHDSENSFYGQL
ncbi:unnamed protein product [Meganyctiphanes norvegica]|uniref:Uncharacterized protein n=1 Tax=Meganyctiphanes norvegica TaxID=48144 RepID=A0AAV2REV6_MEGNR